MTGIKAGLNNAASKMMEGVTALDTVANGDLSSLTQAQKDAIGKYQTDEQKRLAGTTTNRADDIARFAGTLPDDPE